MCARGYLPEISTQSETVVDQTAVSEMEPLGTLVAASVGHSARESSNSGHVFLSGHVRDVRAWPSPGDFGADRRQQETWGRLRNLGLATTVNLNTRPLTECSVDGW